MQITRFCQGNYRKNSNYLCWCYDHLVFDFHFLHETSQMGNQVSKQHLFHVEEPCLHHLHIVQLQYEDTKAFDGSSPEVHSIAQDYMALL